jgi:amino acid permease
MLFFTIVPAFGPSCGELFGVVLFNYAFSVTIPAWFNEKKSRVNVNNVVWGSSTLLTVMYVTFGMLGAMAFPSPPADMLSLLSSRNADVVTRICAGFFG